MPRPLAVACLQTRPMPDFDSALDEALGLADQAEGAELLALPEYCGGLRTEDGLFRPPSAPEAEHPVLAGLRDAARERGVWVLIGSVAIAMPGGRTLNRGYLVDPKGEIRSRYDKIHLFDIQLSESEVYRESSVIEGGGQAVVVDMPQAKIGHTICYDVRFPQLYRDLAQAGAEILCVPAAFTKKTGAAHWHVLNRARAIENLAFVLSPCAVGPVEGGGASYGHSLIISPWGDVLGDGGEEACVVQATVDLDEVATARQRIPSLTHDRAYRAPGEDAKKVA